MRVPPLVLLLIPAIGLTGCIVESPPRRPPPPPEYDRRPPPPPGYGGQPPLTDY